MRPSDFLLALSLASLAHSAASSRKPAKRSRQFQDECLEMHNKLRKQHHSPPLSVDPKLESFAQKRADFIARSDGDQFKHPPDLEFGENLAWHSRETKSCAELVQLWYDEIKLYDFRRPKYSSATGHFTQLVWRNTERLGCARAVSIGPKGGVYLVCNYDPPGNFLGEESENVREPDVRLTTLMAPRTWRSSTPASLGGAASVTPGPPTPGGALTSRAPTSPAPGSPTTPAPSTTTAPTPRSPATPSSPKSTSAGQSPRRKKKKSKRRKSRKNKKANKKRRKSAASAGSATSSPAGL